MQKKWKADTIIEIGRHFVQARYLNASKERRSEAIRLCEDICYNLRRTRGALDLTSLKMSELLSKLYTNMGHYREAQGVHENVLRLVVEGDDGDDRTHDTMDASNARYQVDLLKQSFLRLHGWDKSPEIYVNLVQDLRQMPEYKSHPAWKDVRPANEWNPKEPASETLGKFEAPRTWYLVAPDSFLDEKGGICGNPGRRPGMNVQRATSNWGMNFVHNLLHGNHKDEGNGQKSNGVRKQTAVRDEEDGGYESATEDVL